MGTERDIPRSFCYIQAHPRLKPLPILINYGDECDGSFTYMCCQSCKVVECFFGRGVEYLTLAKSLKPRRFVVGQWRFHFFIQGVTLIIKLKNLKNRLMSVMDKILFRKLL